MENRHQVNTENELDKDLILKLATGINNTILDNVLGDDTYLVNMHTNIMACALGSFGHLAVRKECRKEYLVKFTQLIYQNWQQMDQDYKDEELLKNGIN